jgi:hypothetical protein
MPPVALIHPSSRDTSWAMRSWGVCDIDVLAMEEIIHALSGPDELSTGGGHR